jgi:hypothetical protein
MMCENYFLFYWGFIMQHLLANTIIEREAALLSQGTSFLGVSIAEVRQRKALELIETLGNMTIEDFDAWLIERYRRVVDRKKVAKAAMAIKLFIHSQQSLKVFGN